MGWSAVGRYVVWGSVWVQRTIPLCTRRSLGVGRVGRTCSAAGIAIVSAYGGSRVSFWSGLYSGSGLSTFWRRLTFQHYDPGRLELGLMEQLEGSEYDPRLRGRQGIITFTRMVREDSRLSAALSLIKEPIQAATWQIKASDGSVQRFVEDNLGLSDTPKTQVEWSQLLREQLTALELGFCLHELTFTHRDEHEWLNQVAFRPQISIEKFVVEQDRLASVHQITQFQPEKEIVILPASRLMYTAFARLGTDFWGQSVVRPAYRDWYFKEVLLLISMINAKRYGVPVPHAIASARVSRSSRQQVSKMLSSLSLDQRSHIITGEESPTNPDWKFDWFQPEGARQMENLPLLEYFDSNMVKALSILFLDLGSVSSGNRALGDTFADILYNSLEARCNLIAREVSRQLLTKLVEANFGPSAWARLTWANLELHNMERFVEAFARLAEVYPVPLTVADQERLRAILQMHPPPEDAEPLVPDRQGPMHNMEGVGQQQGQPAD